MAAEHLTVDVVKIIRSCTSKKKRRNSIWLVLYVASPVIIIASSLNVCPFYKIIFILSKHCNVVNQLCLNISYLPGLVRSDENPGYCFVVFNGIANFSH